MIHGDDLAGVAAACAAAACFDGAIVFQALEARDLSTERALRLSMLTRLIRRPRWALATGMAILGWPFQLLALSLAPLSLVQPTLALGLVLLLFLGSRMLHERVGQREGIATVAIVAGVVGMTFSAPKNTDAYNGDWRLITVIGILAVVAAIPYLMSLRSRPPGGLQVASAGAAISASALLSKLVTDELASDDVAAALGWGAATAVAALVGLLSEMSAVQRRPVSRVAPPIFVISTVVPVMFAPFLTGERWGHTPLGGAVIVVSLAAVALGGAMLGRSKAVGTLMAASHREGAERAGAL
jgi:drug/metabolite transporter (DMT)-like permease